MQKRIFMFLGIFLLLVGVVSVSAKSYVAELFQVDDNLVVVSDLDGTAFLMGNTVDISSNINGIGFILGNSLNLSGESEYLFSLGNEINVTGIVENDLFILGNIINIEEDAILGRDSYILGSSVTISGVVERNIYIASDDITLSGTFNGNVTLESTSIVILDGTVINGILKYNEDATIDGLNSDINTTTYVLDTVEYTTMDHVKDIVYSLIARLIVAVVIVFVLNKVFNYIKENNKLNAKEVLVKCGKGLLILVGIPIIGIILLFISFFSSLSILMLVIYGILLYISSLFSAYVIGHLLDNYLIKKNLNNYVLIIIGVLILKLIGLIPLVGGIVTFVAFIYGLGLIGDTLIQYYSKK